MVEVVVSWISGNSIDIFENYELTSETHFAELAEKCLNVYPDRMVNGNLSQCHGMSGMGDIYLEAFRVLQDEMYYKKACELARVILSLRYESEDGDFVWLTEFKQTNSRPDGRIVWHYSIFGTAAVCRRMHWYSIVTGS